MSSLTEARRPGRDGLPALGAVPAGPRRLLHVFPSFEVGGAQVRFAALAEGLGAGFHHDVLSLSGSYEASALVPADAPVALLGPFPRAATLMRRLGAYRTQLAARRPDILLTYNWGAMEMAMANRPGRIPHVHMEDGFGPEEAVRQIGRRVWGRRLALGRSQLAVPSRTLEVLAIREWRIDPRRVHYIPNGVAPRLRPGRALHELGLDLPPGLPVIVWAGALRPEKNPLRVLRAFGPLKDQAVLLVIGSGPERDAVLREAERLELGGSLRLLGRRTDVRDIVMQCQLLALSSDTEQMPLVVLEAMDSGLPVAACDVGDVRRMVSAENRPFVTPVADEALAAALQALVRNAALRARIGAANRRRVRETYTLASMVEAYAALFERVAAPPRGVRAHG